MRVPELVRKSGLALILFAAGCFNPFGPLAPSEREALRRAESRWAAAGIDHYTFEMRTGCFCPPEIYEWAVVEVQDDRIVSATSLTGQPLSGYGLTSRKTVQQMFDTVREERPDWVEDIDVQFDTELGFPVKVSFESGPNIADAGFVLEARNLKRR